MHPKQHILKSLKNGNIKKYILQYIPDIDESIPAGLLIGGNCVKALEPCSVISSENNGPCAIRTRLGWCIVGPMDANSSQIGCNFIDNAGHSCGSSSHCSSLNPQEPGLFLGNVKAWGGQN